MVSLLFELHYLFDFRVAHTICIARKQCVNLFSLLIHYRFNSSFVQSVIVYVSASWRARVVSDYNRNFVNFMRKFCTFLRLFVSKLFFGNIYTLQLFHLGTLCCDLSCFTISGDRTFCDWNFVIINFVITKYHKIVIHFFENVAPFQIVIYLCFKILFC